MGQTLCPNNAKPSCKGGCIMTQVAVIHTAFEDSPRTVALVDVNDDMSTEQKLEYAYRWTNNVMGSWSIKEKFLKVRGDLIENGDYNESVTVMTELENGLGVRSTSMGDQMLLGTTKYKVDMVGFKPIDEEEDFEYPCPT